MKFGLIPFKKNDFKKIDYDFLLDVSISVFFLFFGLCFFFKAGVRTSGDSSIYLAQGLKIILENTYDFHERGPIFPLFISVGFKSLGITVKSAFIVVRLFMILSWGIIYWLTLKLYSRKIAVATVILIITSFGMNIIGEHLLPDTIVPFFILSFFLVLYVAFKQMTFHLFAFAGLLLSVSILTKEVSLIFLPLPLLLLVVYSQNWSWQIFFKVMILYSFTVIPIFLWIQFLEQNSAPASKIVSMGGGMYLDQLLPNIQGNEFKWIEYFRSFWMKLEFIYRDHLLKTSTYLGPFFVFSWGVIGVRFILLRGLSDSVLIGAFLCSFPLLIGVGGMQTRLGQIGFFVILCYIVLGEVLSSVIKLISEINFFNEPLLKYKNLSMNFIFWGVIAFLAFLQMYKGPNQTIDIIDGTYHKRAYENESFFNDNFDVAGRHSTSVKNACSWLLEGISDTSKQRIMTSKPLLNVVDYYTNFKFNNIAFANVIGDSELYRTIENSTVPNKKRILFIFSHKLFGGDIERMNNVNFIFEDDIVRLLHTFSPKYILISYHQKFLEMYLDRAHYAQKVYSNREVSIYKVDNAIVSLVVSFDMITSDIYREEYKTSFKDTFPERYRRIEEILSYFELSYKDLIRNGYYNTQISTILKKIGNSTKRVAVIGEPFPLPDDGNKSKLSIIHVGNNISSSELSKSFDYLIVHGKLQQYKDVQKLIPSRRPFLVFPALKNFGKGLRVYNLN